MPSDNCIALINFNFVVGCSGIKPKDTAIFLISKRFIYQQCVAQSSAFMMNKQIFCVLLCAAMATGLTIVSETIMAMRMLNFKNNIGPIILSLMISMSITPFDN